MIKHSITLVFSLLFFFVVNAQPAITPATGYEWVLTKTQQHISATQKEASSGGCPIIQQQVDGNIGDGRNGGYGNSLGGQNFPARTTARHSFNLQIEGTPNSTDPVSEGATSGTVFIRAKSVLHISPVQDNYSTKKDNYFQLLAIGGQPGNSSEFAFLKTTTTNWQIPALNLSGGSDEITEASFSIETKDAQKNKHHVYENNFLLKKTKPALTVDLSERLFPIAIAKNTSRLKVNISTTSSIAIKRINGRGDARIEYQNTASPQVKLLSEIQCWEIQKRKPITLADNTKTLSKNIVINIQQISCFPNPATDYINVQFSEKVKKGSIQITNSNGQVVYQKVIKNLNSESISTIYLEGFVPGIYQVRILDKTGKLGSTARFVKGQE